MNTEKVQIGAPSLREILRETGLLITFRTKGESGKMALSENDYFKTLYGIIEKKIGDAVDIELYHNKRRIREFVKTAHKKGTIVIMSNHDFEKTPSKEEVIMHLHRMIGLGADVVKIAVMLNSRTDVLTLLQAAKEFPSKLPTPLITISMGNLGKISRLAGGIFGSALIFAAVAQTSALGQIELTHLKQELEYLHLN